ncbi:hypothetical protein EYC95_25275 [Pseudomonas sp. BGI-2]|nr:hypothetical protein EYC95_25275 [Pseudomonas sp. BGI-2]
MGAGCVPKKDRVAFFAGKPRSYSGLVTQIPVGARLTREGVSPNTTKKRPPKWRPFCIYCIRRCLRRFHCRLTHQRQYIITRQ